MGCSKGDGECSSDEKPAHDVEITQGFWLGQTAVTVSGWERYRTATKKRALPKLPLRGRKVNEVGEEPAVAMTWKEAQQFCRWSGGRLPTEAEWEYAARAGNPNARYGEVDAIAWFGDNSGAQRLDTAQLLQSAPAADSSKRIIDNGGGPHPVAQKQPNAWNLYDMLGNVLQWTADWYDERSYSSAVVSDPTGPQRGEVHTLRGGSWFSTSKNIRVSFRFGAEPVYRYGYFGFRCLLNNVP
jgi:formylglycine-generating enzyme required for sulfatase activity